MSVDLRNTGTFFGSGIPTEAKSLEKELWSVFLEKITIPDWFTPESYFLVLPIHLKDFIADSPKWFVYHQNQDITYISVVKRGLWTKYNKLGE